MSNKEIEQRILNYDLTIDDLDDYKDEYFIETVTGMVNSLYTLFKSFNKNTGLIEDIFKKLECIVEEEKTEEKLRLIDDLIIYKLKTNTYLIVCNASRVDEDINWMSLNQRGYNINLDNESHNLSLLAVQGPKAIDLMHKLGYTEDQDSFTIIEGKLLNIPMYISRTGYTGERTGCDK